MKIAWAAEAGVFFLFLDLSSHEIKANRKTERSSSGPKMHRIQEPELSLLPPCLDVQVSTDVGLT